MLAMIASLAPLLTASGPLRAPYATPSMSKCSMASCRGTDVFPSPRFDELFMGLLKNPQTSMAYPLLHDDPLPLTGSRRAENCVHMPLSDALSTWTDDSATQQHFLNSGSTSAARK